MGEENKQFGLGVALSGGGSKGFAHLGILKAMGEIGLQPDIISGTSAGAFVGVLYADGHQPDEIITFFERKVFREFAEITIPQTGFFKNTRFSEFLKQHLRARTFEELKIPLRVVATDIEYGESFVFSSGPLIHPVVASCTVPIIFTPVTINGRHYVDGGLFKNFPVSVIRKTCDKIIGANVSPLTRTEYKKSLKYVAERSFHYMSASNTLLDRNLCDYLIESDKLSKYSTFDLDHVQEIYTLGYKTAINYFEKNKELIETDFNIKL